MFFFFIIKLGYSKEMLYLAKDKTDKLKMNYIHSELQAEKKKSTFEQVIIAPSSLHLCLGVLVSSTVSL